MKNLKIILITIVVLFLGFSCEDDGGTSVIPLNDGAVPNMVKSTSTDAFFDLVKVNAGENVTVSFSADVAQGNPVSVDVVGIYRSSLGPVYSATLFSNVSLPQDFNISISDIVGAFAEINSSADILLADILTITLRFTMADGTVLNIINDDGNNNVGTNIQTNVDLFTYKIDYPVSCVSDLGGNYNVVSSGFSTDGAPINNPIVNFSFDVVVTDNGGGSYTISDGVAGVYQDWYCAPYGYCFETPGNFTEVCGTLMGTWVEAFGCPIELTGTVNEDGTLTIQWSNCFGDEVTEAIYTPQ